MNSDLPAVRFPPAAAVIRMWFFRIFVKGQAKASSGVHNFLTHGYAFGALKETDWIHCAAAAAAASVPVPVGDHVWLFPREFSPGETRASDFARRVWKPVEKTRSQKKKRNGKRYARTHPSSAHSLMCCRAYFQFTKHLTDCFSLF